jgi:hypothetical protein
MQRNNPRLTNVRCRDLDIWERCGREASQLPFEPIAAESDR